MESVTSFHRSSAIQAYRELLVWDFHPLVIRAVRAHVVLRPRDTLSRNPSRPTSTICDGISQESWSGPTELAKRVRLPLPGRRLLNGELADDRLPV